MKKIFFSILLIFAAIMLIVDLSWLKLYMKKEYTNLFSKLNLRLNNNIVGGAIAYMVMIASYPLLIYNKHDNLKQSKFQFCIFTNQIAKSKLII